MKYELNVVIHSVWDIEMLIYAVGLISHVGQTQVFPLEIKGLSYIYILSCNVTVI